MKLIAVIVDLSLLDILRLRSKYTAMMIDSLPFQLRVGHHMWYLPENIYKVFKTFIS